MEALQSALGKDVAAAVLSPEILIGTFSYLLLKPLLKQSGLIDTTKGAYRNSMILYNVLMAAYSGCAFLATATVLGWDRGYGQWLRDLTGDKVVTLYQDNCPSPVFESKIFVWVAWSFYYSKYVEYLDTAWLVLKGKPVSFLQTFHHFGAPWDVYLAIMLKNEGLWIFLAFNSFIHTVMYSYFAFTAAGFPYPGKFIITLMQISQFIVGFIVVYPYWNIPCFRASQEMMFSWAFNYAYVGTVLALFLHFFYNDNFVKKPSKKEKKK